MWRHAQSSKDDSDIFLASSPQLNSGFEVPQPVERMSRALPENIPEDPRTLRAIKVSLPRWDAEVWKQEDSCDAAADPEVEDGASEHSCSSEANSNVVSTRAQYEQPRRESPQCELQFSDLQPEEALQFELQCSDLQHEALDEDVASDKMPFPRMRGGPRGGTLSLDLLYK